MQPFRYSAPLRIAREGGITGDCVGSVHGTTHQALRHGVGCLGSGLQREKSAVKGGVSATWSGASAPDEINCSSPFVVQVVSDLPVRTIFRFALTAPALDSRSSGSYRVGSRESRGGPPRVADGERGGGLG